MLHSINTTATKPQTLPYCQALWRLIVVLNKQYDMLLMNKWPMDVRGDDTDKMHSRAKLALDLTCFGQWCLPWRRQEFSAGESLANPPERFLATRPRNLQSRLLQATSFLSGNMATFS